MKINNIYIISWFGKDPALADKRRDMQQVPKDWLNTGKNNQLTGIRGMWSKWHNLGPVIPREISQNLSLISV